MTYSYPPGPNQFPPHHYVQPGGHGEELPKRPAVVTIAGAIMVLHVVLHAAMGFITGFVAFSESQDTAAGVLFLVSSVVIGLVFLFLAIGVFRGLQAARITSIVLYAVFTGLCCLFNGLILSEALVGTEVLDEGLTVVSVMSIVAMASYFAVVTLMVTPTSRNWFAEISRIRRNKQFLR